MLSIHGRSLLAFTTTTMRLVSAADCIIIKTMGAAHDLMQSVNYGINNNVLTRLQTLLEVLKKSYKSPARPTFKGSQQYRRHKLSILHGVVS